MERWGRRGWLKGSKFKRDMRQTLIPAPFTRLQDYLLLAAMFLH